MTLIDDVHIRRLDLTLLIVFERLLKKRNMSAVAAEMGLSQSAVSHAVARLRSIFGDPLFVRKGAGVEPTARAILLGAPLEEALTAIRAAAQTGRSFDPAKSRRRFALAAPDTIVATFAPGVLAELAQAAPHCQLIVRTFSHEAAAAAVAAGEVDLAMGVFDRPPAQTVRLSISLETLGVVSKRDHPRIFGGLDLETYCTLDHILVSHEWEARGLIDGLLDAIGRRRRPANPG